MTSFIRRFLAAAALAAPGVRRRGVGRRAARRRRRSGAAARRRGGDRPADRLSDRARRRRAVSRRRADPFLPRPAGEPRRFRRDAGELGLCRALRRRIRAARPARRPVRSIFPSARPTRRRRSPISRVSRSSTPGASPSSASRRAATSRWRSPPRRRAALRLRAAAAYYPPCANRQGETLTVPTLILVGAADSVTPAADCRAFVAAQPPGAPRRGSSFCPAPAICSTIPLPPAAGSFWACISPTTAPRRRAPNRNCADFWRRHCRRRREGD